jgi:hypothetical protein
VIDPDEIFFPLLQSVSNLLIDDPFFSATRTLSSGQVVSIPVITQNIGDVEQELDLALGKTGIVAFVRMGGGNDIMECEGPVINGLEIVVEVAEVAIVNRGTRTVPSHSGTLKSAGAVICRTIELLHFQRLPATSSPLKTKSFSEIIVNDEEGGKPVHIGWAATFVTSMALNYRADQIEKPVITQTNQTYTIACATPNAQIFYTKTRGLPIPRAGTLYTGESITLLPGQRLQARAYLAGYLDSELAVAP